MAIPFFEPKTPKVSTNNNTNNSTNTDSNTNNGSFENHGQPANNMLYDQVDGLLSNNQHHSTLAQQAATMPPTAMPHSSATMPALSMQEPTTASTPLTSPSFSMEQQVLAWKILALTLCKALKEYHLQSASSKDTFTNPTVQILPNDDIQPIWK